MKSKIENGKLIKFLQDTVILCNTFHDYKYTCQEHNKDIRECEKIFDGIIGTGCKEVPSFMALRNIKFSYTIKKNSIAMIIDYINQDEMFDFHRYKILYNNKIYLIQDFGYELIET